MKGRREHADEIDRHLQAWLHDRDRDDVVARLVSAGVAAAPMVEAADILRLPPLAERGFVERFEHPTVGAHAVSGVPFRLGAHDGPWFHRAAPTLGQHNDEVLGGLLGLSTDELNELRDAGVIGERPAGLRP